MDLRPGWYLLFGLIATLLSGCAGPGVSGDDYALIANPPELESVSPTFTEREFDRGFAERYQWTYRPGGWPAADLIFVRVKEIYGGRLSFRREETLPELVDTAFSTRSITLGTRGTTTNVLGDLDYQHFSVDTVADCVYIEQGMSRFSDGFEPNVPNVVPLGDMYVRGWYCVPPSTPDQGALFRKFIDSIGIYGYAEPDT